MEDFVPFEIAKKLKEKGFREKTLSMYLESVKLPHIPLIYSLKDWNKEDNCYSAPTISQILKWLREEKKLHIEIYMYHNCYLWEIYNTEIYDADFTQKSEKYSEIEYATYELAAITGIEYVIDKLI